jgi:hypothetical protein
MPELKKLSHDGVGAALEKAERYRLLNEPWAAESICRDILAVEPKHQKALVELVLALTEQFGTSGSTPANEVRRFVAMFDNEYARAYYSGIISERLAKAQLGRSGPGSGHNAYEHLHDAMEWYEKAEKLGPAGDESAVLRFNTCVRMLQRYPNLGPAPEHAQSMLE